MQLSTFSGLSGILLCALGMLHTLLNGLMSYGRSGDGQVDTYIKDTVGDGKFDAAFLDLPRISALLVRRLRGATSLPEATASGLRSVIAGLS